MRKVRETGIIIMEKNQYFTDRPDKFIVPPRRTIVETSYFNLFVIIYNRY